MHIHVALAYYFGRTNNTDMYDYTWVHYGALRCGVLHWHCVAWPSDHLTKRHWLIQALTQRRHAPAAAGSSRARLEATHAYNAAISTTHKQLHHRMHRWIFCTVSLPVSVHTCLSEQGTCSSDIIYKRALKCKCHARSHYSAGGGNYLS